jgi:hypothetical protein
VPASIGSGRDESINATLKTAPGPTATSAGRSMASAIEGRADEIVSARPMVLLTHTCLEQLQVPKPAGERGHAVAQDH